jgi:hypothetical protein
MDLDPRQHDPGSPSYRLVALALMLAFLSFLSWLNASNFDETELKTIGWWAMAALVVLFAPDVARRFLGNGSTK